MRIQQLSKTRSQWEDISTKINDGEICFEKNNESSPMTYKMKIGDGNHKYADLPYFTATDSEGNDITTVILTWVNNNLDASEIALAEWDGVSKLSIYCISESDGIISKGDNHLDVTVGSPLTISENNDTVTIGIQDATISQKGAVTLTNTYDDTNETKATTGKAIKAAIETLDGNATTEDTTGSTAVIINSVSETDGIISSTKKTITEGNKIDISVPISGNDAGKIIIAHENVASSGGEAINPSDDGTLAFGDYVLTEASRDSQGHIISAKKKALPANPNTHYTSDIIIGGTSSTVTESSSDISSDPYLNHIENSAVTSSHKIEGGTNITTSFNATNHNITITHNTPSNGSSVNPSYPSGSDTLGFGDDVITDFTKDSQGHVVSATKKKLPINPLTVTSANDATVMIGHHNSGNATASATGYTISNNALSGSITTIPTNYSVKKYVDDEIKDAIVGVFKYMGIVGDYQDLESARLAGVKEGYVYIANQDITLDVSTAYLPAGHYEIGDNFIWQGDDNLSGKWNVVSGEDNVTNNNITLNLQGALHTLATVNGTGITVTSPTLQINSPTASGNTTSFIDTLTVSNGQLSATKKTVPDASTSAKGIIQIASSHSSSDSSKSATGATVESAITSHFVNDIHSASDTNKYPTAKQTWDELAVRNTQFASGNHTNITNPSKGILQDPETISPHKSGVTAVHYLPITTKDAVVGLNYEIAPQEVNYTHRAIPESGDGVVNPKIATIETVKGNTLVWNQLAQETGTPSSGNGLTVTRSDNVFTVSGLTTSDSYFGFYAFETTPIIGHKYLLMIEPITWNVEGGNFVIALRCDTSAQVTKDVPRAIGTANQAYNTIRIYHGNNVSVNVSFKINVFYLTTMFGAGHEPSVDDFKLFYPLSYYPYNRGILINNTASGIKTVGFNQWDGIYYAGLITSDGTINTSSSVKHSDYIRVFPSTKYYINYGVANQYAAFSYDIDYNFLGKHAGNSPNGIEFTTHENAAYVRINIMPDNVGKTCLNLSWSGYRNGEYEPYQENIVYFDSNWGASGSLATIKGKLLVDDQPTGESVEVFPLGMKSAGTAYDEAKGTTAKKVLSENIVLSNINWVVDSNGLAYSPRMTNLKGGVVNSKANFITTAPYTPVVTPQHHYVMGDNEISISTDNRIFIHDTSCTTREQLNTKLANAVLCAELATPETYLLDNPLPSLYGKNPTTEEHLPADTASVVAAPIRYTARYDIAYVSLATLNNLVNAINTIFRSYDGGSIHPVLKSETNDFDFITQLPLA